MKKIFTILTLMFSIAVFAQNGDEAVAALKSADAAKFTSYFDNAVDVKLPQKAEIKDVNKAEASSKVISFFSDNKITAFEQISKGELNGTSYIAGKLTGAAQTYNITVMLKNNSVITVRIN